MYMYNIKFTCLHICDLLNRCTCIVKWNGTTTISLVIPVEKKREDCFQRDWNKILMPSINIKCQWYMYILSDCNFYDFYLPVEQQQY